MSWTLRSLWHKTRLDTAQMKQEQIQRTTKIEKKRKKRQASARKPLRRKNMWSQEGSTEWYWIAWTRFKNIQECFQSPKGPAFPPPATEVKMQSNAVRSVVRSVAFKIQRTQWLSSALKMDSNAISSHRISYESILSHKTKSSIDAQQAVNKQQCKAKCNMFMIWKRC